MLANQPYRRWCFTFLFGQGRRETGLSFPADYKPTIHMRRIIILIAAFALLPSISHAQKWAIGTNIADWVQLGTANVEGSVAVARHWSINAGVRVNPWTWHKDDGAQLQNRQQTYSAGARWWPWYVYSGWWLGARGQYSEYNNGGIIKSETEEGDAFGAGLSAGYTLMVHQHINLEFGAGLWGGYKYYTRYACPKCGYRTDEGQKWFILPDDVFISLIWVF